MTIISGPPSSTEQLFALTICACRKPGMDEDEYHQYTSLDHAKKLTDLMVQKRIVEYTMVCLHRLTGPGRHLDANFPSNITRVKPGSCSVR